jgi:DnaJ-class molecular chaperone
MPRGDVKTCPQCDGAGEDSRGRECAMCKGEGVVPI